MDAEALGSDQHAGLVAGTWDEVRRRAWPAEPFPKIGPLMDGAKSEVLAFAGFPRARWSMAWWTKPLEGVTGPGRP